VSDFKVEGQSEWDQRQAFMQRLHNNIVLCSEALQYKDFNQWLRSLISLKIDLSAHIEKESKEVIDKKINNAFSIIKSNVDEYSKIKLLTNIQELLHKVMRDRKFDVPINDKSPGSIIVNDRSY
jgi:hypothetical protein